MFFRRLLRRLFNLGFISANGFMFLMTMHERKLAQQEREVAQFFGKTTSILVVTAHPDDIGLYFAPAFDSLATPMTRNYILSLCNGNADGQGAMREKDLARFCAVRPVDAHQVVHDAALP